uniref:Uncharacterized protein n=1 Tax=Parascaris equorum TaxID=6256 RepID=A0A914RZX0_PAREQ
VAHEVVQNYWSSGSGQLPPDVPRCGFDGGLCDYTTIYILIATLTIIAILVPAGYFVYLKTMERRLYDMTWRIPRDDIRLVTGGSLINECIGRVYVLGIVGSTARRCYIIVDWLIWADRCFSKKHVSS